MKSLKPVHLFALSTFVLGAVSCSSKSAPTYHLEDSAPDLDAERARLRQMQMVRVIKQSDDPDDPENGKTFEWDDQHLAEALFDTCPDPGASSTACSSMLGSASTWYCYGELALAVASGAQDVVLTYHEAKYKVPPQSAATTSKAAIDAAANFSEAMKHITPIFSGENVSGAGACPPPNAANSTVPPGQLDRYTAEQATSLFIDAYQKAKKAFELAGSSILSVADAQLASSANFQTGAARSMAGPDLSRAALAHILVGGEPGINGVTSKAMCSSGRLSGPAQRALEIIREAGVSPADVLQAESALSTTRLLNGEGSTALTNGSVRQRFEDTWGTAFPDAQSVEDFYGLKTTDFQAARAYLQDEIKAFSRSKTAKLAKRKFAEGRLETYARFSGVTAPPTELPNAYWMAVALTEGPVPGTVYGGDTRQRDDGWAIARNSLAATVPGDMSRSFAGLADYAKSWAALATSKSAFQSFKTELVNPLLNLMAGTDLQGRATQCYRVDSAYDQTFALYGPSNGAAVVFGEDNLRCAIDGSIEGAPCSLSISLAPTTDLIQSPPQPLIYQMNTTLASRPEFKTGAKVTVGYQTNDTERAYIIRPRTGITNPHPGDYVALAGFPPYLSNLSTWNQSDTICREFPIAQEALEGTAKALAPSKAWCGESSTMCDGSRFDDRIPLEDELTDDGDGVESSWKHYLTLAQNAAAESDALGKEYVEASLNKDVRAETVSLRTLDQQQRAAAELDKLQQICGTSINPERLLRVMGEATDSAGATIEGVYDLSAWVTAPCGNGEAAPGGVGWKCIEGHWTLTWARIAEELSSSDPEVAKLQKCIRSADETKAYVHLGDAPLCLSATQVQLAKKEECGTNACESGATCVGTDDGLKLFSTRAVMPHSPGRSLCDRLRELRKTPILPTSNWVERLVANGALNDSFLNTGNIRQLAQGLDIRLDYNDHVTVSASGAKFSTGSTGQPNTSTWPCASAGGATNCTAGTGLFCTSANCSDPASRGLMVRRLYSAALAAKLITWTTGDPKPSIDVPVWIDEDLNPTDAPANTAGLRVGGVPIEVWANSKWRAFYVNSTSPTVLRATSVGAAGTDYLPIRTQITQRDAYTFAFTHVDLDPKDLLSAYWNGVGENPGEQGYFAKVFFGQSHDQAKPSDAPSMVMPGGVAVPFGTGFAYSDSEIPFNEFYITEYREKLIKQDLSLWPQKGDPDAAWLYFTSNPEEVVEFELFPNKWVLRPVLTPIVSNEPWTYDYDHESVMDGLELLCEAGLRMSGQSRSSCGTGDNAPQLNTLSDMNPMGSYLQCLGDDIRRRAATATFTDFPSSVVDELQSSTQGAFQTASGTMADFVSQLRIALTDVAQSGPTIGREIQGFGQDLKDLQAAITIYDSNKQMNDVRFEATAAQQMTNCIAESAHDAGIASITSFAGVAAVATCVNSAAQIGFADKLRSLGDQQNAAQRETAIADFNRRFTDHATALQRESLRLSAALESVRRVLGQIESERQLARRAIESAMWLLSAQATNTPAINNAMGALSETARTRYVRAFSNAKRMAFLAKRAIEQRLGLSLNEMTEELPLVDAPAHWASTVCDTSGIDYASIADGTTKNFADAFIGDYVKKLENVVESYRLKHNFHEGRDTAVVSLRDDVMNVRANCSVASPNLLLHASNLEHVDPVSPSTQPGWHLTGCEVDSNGLALPDCVTTTRSPYVPLRVRPFEQTPILGYTIAFGNGGTCAAPTCGWKAGAGLSQTVDLTPGTYRFSWFTRDSFSIAGGNLQVASIVDASGNELSRSTPTCPGAMTPSPGGCFLPGNSDTWNRLYFTFNVAKSGPVTVTFKHPGDIYPVQLAAPMLERVDDPTYGLSSPEPKVFSDTTDQRTQTLPVCEDTSGALFRGLWTRGCERVCPDGYSSDCRERAQLHCYRQTSFNLSQRAAETGQLFKAAGFALGNFNYRLESVGLNFVGTGLRDCADSNLPTTCNAAGFMPYTLAHDGPYFVRNYQGEDFIANLFSGHIEHARGLATERYLTNPISSSDQSLLEPYLRAEFRGRPLDGTFTLRVWDEDSAVFDKLQDVQLAITYRYWTRFN